MPSLHPQLRGTVAELKRENQRLHAYIGGMQEALRHTSRVSIHTEGEKQSFMADTLKSLDSMRKKAMQLALAGGECLVKPVIMGGRFRFSIVRRDCYLVLSRDPLGGLSGVGSAEFTAQGRFYYTLLENCVDGSDDGVAVYAAATGLIRNINRNERQMNDEFENGASRIIASDDMMTQDGHGNRKLSDKLFVGINEDQSDVGITIFSPALREQSYLARKTEYLRNIETQIGLKRGILSEVEAAERTAKEVTSSEGDYNLTVMDFQQMWESTVRETLGICDALGQMYKLCGSQHFDPAEMVSIDWGDGVLFDRTRTWNEYKDMVAAGLLKPEIALGWYFEQPCETAEDLVAIRTKYMPEMEEMLGGD